MASPASRPAVAGLTMVRDFGAKLRITAAALGCASQKDLCARFRAVNPSTEFELDRSYKWMQGRAQPRSARVYEDWARLLDTERPVAWLQSCTMDEFLELLCGRFEVSREALAVRACIVAGAPAEMIEVAPDEARMASPRYRHLVGTYAWYGNPWSSCLQGKIIRGALVIAATAQGVPELRATTMYSGPTASGRVQLSGPVRVNRSICLDLIDAGEEFRVSMYLFVPGALAGVLAGVASGASWFDPDPQPAASRIVLVRIPGATAEELEATNRYFDPTRPLSSDLAALGVPAAALAGLDALLAEFLRSDHPSGCVMADRAKYAQLALAIDRLVMDGGSRVPLKAVARRAAAE
jgi:hypothetical protein